MSFQTSLQILCHPKTTKVFAPSSVRSLAPLRRLPDLPHPQLLHPRLRPLLPRAAVAASAAGWPKRGDEVVVGILRRDLELHCLELPSNVVLAKRAAAGVDRHAAWLSIL